MKTTSKLRPKPRLPSPGCKSKICPFLLLDVLETNPSSYNNMAHPIPFMKASSVVAPAKASRDKPDLEEAIEDEDEAEAIAAAEPVEEDDEDIGKDKYIKKPKPKAAKKATAKKATKASAKAKAADDDDDEEEEKPKARGRAKRAKK